MATELTDMVIDEISLVDDPANEQARVAIVKARGGAAPESDVTGALARIKKAFEDIAPALAQTLAEGLSANEAAATAATALKEYGMDIESLSKALEDAEAKLTALSKRADQAEAGILDAEKVIKAKDEEITKLQAAAPAVDAPASDEEVLKGLPESIRKRLEASEAAALAAETAVTKMRDETERNEAIVKAKSLKVGDPEVVGPLLLRVAKGKTTAEDAATLERVFKAVGEQSAAGDRLFRAVGADGSNAADAGDPEQVLKAKADEIRKAKPTLTGAQAYAAALEQNPDVYDAYINKRRVA